MTKFKEILDSITDGNPHKLKITKLELSIRADNLVPKESPPVGLIGYLYHYFVVCKIRNEPFLEKFCYAKFICFGPILRNLKWFQCIRIFTKIIFISIVLSPWIIRLVIYDLYESQEVTDRGEVAAENNMSPAYNSGHTNIINANAWSVLVLSRCYGSSCDSSQHTVHEHEEINLFCYSNQFQWHAGIALDRCNTLVYFATS